MKDIQSLAKAYEGYFKIGAAINNRTIRTHGDLIAEHFNSVTCENQMKLGPIHPSLDQYDFAPADEIAAFAKAHHIPMRGHTLVWHNQSPDWVFVNEKGDPASRELVLSRIQEHMQTVMSRYKDQVYCWDVVNEAVCDTSRTVPASSGSYMRKSKWTDFIGEDFVEQAFKMAASVNSGAKLYYNEYNEWFPAKRDGVIKLIKQLKEKDTPIDGLGLQAHFSLHWPTADEMRKSIDMYAGLGLRLQFTEMDVTVYNDREKDTELPGMSAEMLDRESAYYDAMFGVFREYKDIIDAVTFWGVADDATWLNHWHGVERKDWPLLFDDNHQPKDAFFKVVNF